MVGIWLASNGQGSAIDPSLRPAEVPEGSTGGHSMSDQEIIKAVLRDNGYSPLLHVSRLTIEELLRLVLEAQRRQQVEESLRKDEGK
jgi:hypothetical protein